MKKSLKCKDNNAANVKGMMPGGAWTATPQRATNHHKLPVITDGRWQKELDSGLNESIIIFTDLAESFRDAHGRQRYQARDAPTTRDAEPAPERCQRRAVSSGQLFDPRDLVQVKYEMLRRVQTEGQSVTDAAANFGFSRPSFYQALSGFEQDGLAGLVPRKRGPKQAHKLTEEVLTFIGEVRQKEPSVRLPDLVKLIQERFGTKVHPRSIERSLVRHQKKLR